MKGLINKFKDLKKKARGEREDPFKQQLDEEVKRREKYGGRS